MNFSEFFDAATSHLKLLGCQTFLKGEVIGKNAHWWLSFTRAGCLYRLVFARHEATLSLERGQGSFVVQAPTTWRILDSREPADLDLETALASAKELLLRFKAPARD